MKIDQNRNVIPFEPVKTTEKKSTEAPPRAQVDTRNQDQVDSKLTNALNGAVDAIKNSGLSPAEVHSRVDDVSAQGLLRASSVDSSQPRLTNDELLKMADKVVADSQRNASQAYNAFNQPDSNRVSQLL
jgi:hypothetical protein